MLYCALCNTQQLLRPYREQVDCLTSIARSVEFCTGLHSYPYVGERESGLRRYPIGEREIGVVFEQTQRTLWHTRVLYYF